MLDDSIKQVKRQSSHRGIKATHQEPFPFSEIALKNFLQVRQIGN
jgi:hypothetical protein